MYIYILPPIIASTIYYLYKNKLDLMFDFIFKNKISFSSHNNSIIMKYDYMGNNNHLVLPYNRKKVSNMINYTASLHLPNGKHIDITQKAGIPYIVSAHDLEGNYIRIINTETGIYHDYIDKFIPMYADELIDTE